MTQARDERAALSAMLTQMAGGTSKLAQTSKSLEQVGQKADAALKKLDELGQKVSGYEDRAKGLEQIEKRIAAMLDQVNEAQRISEKITAPDGELQKHRLAVNQLASQALENQATIETLRKEKRVVRGSARRSSKASTVEVVKSVETRRHAERRARCDSLRRRAADHGVPAHSRNLARSEGRLGGGDRERSRKSRRSSARSCSCRSSARTPKSASPR